MEPLQNRIASFNHQVPTVHQILALNLNSYNIHNSSPSASTDTVRHVLELENLQYSHGDGISEGYILMMIELQQTYIILTSYDLHSCIEN